jgi:DNA repair and recombination protein RAD54B
MKRKYNCLYRKAQSKKHKTWDNDGYLIVDESHWILIDEDGKEVQRCSAKPISPESGVEIRLLGLEVQIGSEDSTLLTAPMIQSVKDSITQDSTTNSPLEAGMYRICFRSIFKKVSFL